MASSILNTTYDIYNVVTQPDNTSFDNNLSYLMNNDNNLTNLTTTSSYGVVDDYLLQDDLYGNKKPSTPKKQLPQPTKPALTSTLSSALSSLANKLPPIPSINTSLYSNDPLQPLETKSTNDNDDSMFSRFNSYESESAPYSTSNDLSMHTLNNSTSKYDNTATSGHLYGNGDMYGTDMDYYTGDHDSSDLSYQTQQNRISISDMTTSSFLASILGSSAITTTAPSKTLPPIPDNAYSSSKLDTQNSNMSYLSDDYPTTLNHLDSNYMDTSTTSNLHDDYLGTCETPTNVSHLLNNDYQFDEQYNTTDFNATSTTTAPITTSTANHLTDSAYTSDYYENCQYDYEYTENETDYLASGDIIEKGKTNLYQNNNNYNNSSLMGGGGLLNTPMTTSSIGMSSSLLTTQQQLNTAITSNTTITSSLSSSAFINNSSNLTQQQSPMLGQAKQQEPNKTASILGQSKSLLGGLGSMIGKEKPPLPKKIVYI